MKNFQQTGPNSDSPEASKPDTIRPLRVLMVCTGNICRSTMAEQVLRESAERAGMGAAVEVDSAGITNWERGNPIDSRAAQVLTHGGYEVPAHRARQVTASELGRWDLVLGMTKEHVDDLKQLAAAGGVEVRNHLGVATSRSGSPDNTVLASQPFVLDHSPAVTIQRFRDFDPQGKGDVPDPWYGTYEDFIDTLAVIERVTPFLLDQLQAARPR